MEWRLTIPMAPMAYKRVIPKGAYSFHDPIYSKWRKDVGLIVATQWRSGFFESPVPLRVHAFFFLPKPAKGKPGSKLTHPTNRFDIDNLLKALFDAITKTKKVWQDDAQIISVTAQKQWSTQPKIELFISTYKNEP